MQLDEVNIEGVYPVGVWSPELGYKRNCVHARFSAVRANRVDGVIFPLGPAFCCCFLFSLWPRRTGTLHNVYG